MTTPTPPAHPPAPVPPRTLVWLRGELDLWRADGLVDDEQAQRILGRYEASQRFSLATLVLTLGAAFVGFGVIWLVAANLDQLPPLARFLVVAAFWVAFTVGAEWLAGRGEHGGAIPSPVVGAARILATLVFGGVVFQAAQSMQVPAYEPKLVGLWAAGALVYAYLVRAVGPLLVGEVAGVGWFVWQVAWSEPSGLAVVLAFLIAGVLATSVAVLHGRWLREFSPAWRETGAALLLIGLFAAAIPTLGREDFVWSVPLVAGLAVAGLLAATAIALSSDRARWEPLAALTIAGIGVLLVLWEAGADAGNVDLAAWGHAALAISTFVAAAAGVAALGILHDSWRLTALATGGLVVFTTFQAFAVFAEIIQGAWLFVFLGLIFLATGYVADRARRRLAVSLEGEL
jgi:uncharacterized membrane protein